MESTTLQAEVRAGRGKGPARRLRAQGKLPAVFYGPGVEPTPLTVDPAELEKPLRGVFGRNTVFSLSYNGGAGQLAMLKDLQVDPVTREPLHADFVRVLEDQEVVVDVPFQTEGRSVGVVAGGILNVTRRAVPLKCVPSKIPALIKVDVTDVGMFDTISVKDLPLPEGVSCILKPELTLAIVLEDKKAARLAAKEEKEAAGAEKTED